MYDRLFTILGWQGFEGVRDFIYVSLINWPVFNLADAFICTGVFLLTWDILFTKEPATAPAAAQTQGTTHEPSNPAGTPDTAVSPRPSDAGENDSGESVDSAR